MPFHALIVTTSERSAPISAGVNAWRAAERGVAVEGLRSYGEGGPSALVVGYAAPPDHAFTGAVARLGAALDSAT